MFESIVRSWWVFAVRGALAILFGIMAFAWPHATLFALVTLFGALALFDGIMSLLAVPTLRDHSYRWWWVLDGILGVAVGALTFLYPGATAMGLLMLLGGWLVVSGIFRIVVAIELRKHIQNEWLIILNGVLSVAAGVLTVVWPGPSALAVVWVIGIYAIISGVTMIGASAKLHRMRTHLPKATTAL